MANDWRYRAACRRKDPETFFPTAAPGTPRHAAEVAEARQICATCPVIFDCRAWALDNGMDEGVWGGLDEVERRAIRRNQIEARR